MKNNGLLYKWLIVTFIVLYAATAFVSFYHSITFFGIANAVWLSIILSAVAEIGQASVLFSLLLTKNKNNFLAWTVMFLLTALQIVGNVVSSFKYISELNSMDFTYFQNSILFWVTNTDAKMFKVIISWITGGILPVIALSMTALVADNLKLREEDNPDDITHPIEIEPDKEPVKESDVEDVALLTEPGMSEVETAKEVKNKSSVKSNRLKRKAKPKAKSRVPKLKSTKLTTVNDLSSIKKMSKGTELIQSLENDEFNSNEENIITQKKDEQGENNAPPLPSDSNVVSIISKDGKIIDKNYK